ncbi:MAG TPA: phosphoenolpyruvate--protein phosphotransferase [Ruminococcus sp.]|nr:phosphoenolpyruvate--protein phosphotransferase [Ruminococcus sp.]
MKTIKGKGVSGGIAIGKIRFIGGEELKVRRIHCENSEAELERFHAAEKISMNQLQNLYDKAVKEVGEANAQIFAIHQMMLEDDDYTSSISNIITSQKVNAEYAVAVTSDNFSEMFSSMDDEYMQARSADVKDISDRLIKNLSGKDSEISGSDEKVIIFADDLSPSETVQMDKNSVLAFVTAKGSSNSHTAILARTMSLPAIVGIGSQPDQSFNGKTAVVNAVTGEIFIDPDDETIAEHKKLISQNEERLKLINQLKGKENITADGRKINIYANIGGLADIGAALKNDAGGIGLFRSEFLYLENNDYPTEEEQFSVYKTAAENMAGKPVIIRTLDIGADKQIDYFNMPKEDNPAMGWRALRICLDRPEIFRTQLRALYRASAYGNIQIMVPMITSVWEVKEIKKIIDDIKKELENENIPFNENTPFGIMIETPAAVMVSDMLAEEVDFFSIGTNDLTQYTLAVDRQNTNIDKYYNPYHPAVLKLINIAVQNAHKKGIWCGICGELGGDPEMTRLFLAMGVDELSMAPGKILEIRKIVRETDTSEIPDSEKSVYKM